jgi:hypothetical protein
MDHHTRGREPMKRIVLVLLTLFLLSLACSSPFDTSPSDTPDTPTQDAQPPAAQSEKRCGDGVCDGPENTELCPQDCPAAPIQSMEKDTDAQDPPSADPDQEQSQQPNESGYRYVSFSGTIRTTLNEELMGDFTGTAFEYAADYSIELWFPMAGGTAVQQRNTIALTEFHDLYYGDQTCVPCQWTLDTASFEPLSFDLDASLTLEGIMEGDETVDELAYQLTSPPTKVLTGTALCPCPGAIEGDITDPAAFPQLFAWFMQGITDPVHFQSLSASSVEMFPISPMSYISIPEQSLSYVTVPDLNTP